MIAATHEREARLKYEAELRRSSKEQHRANILRIAFNILVPLGLCVFFHWLTCFVSRDLEWLIQILEIVGMLIVLASAYWTLRNYRRSKVYRWFLFSTIMLFAAVSGGIITGRFNYEMHMRPFFEYKQLANYVNVNPSTERGQSFMDSGSILFMESSMVDTTLATAFRNRDTFCVAPVVKDRMTPSVLGGKLVAPYAGTIDFWAIGVNCCDTDGKNFKCADSGKATARSGLRLLRDDQRVFFNLAAQEWSSQYGVPVRHPLFFYWVVDPVSEEGQYEIDAWNFFFYFAITTIAACVMLTMAVFVLFQAFDPNIDAKHSL